MRRTSRRIAGVAGLTAAAAVALGGTAVAASDEGSLGERVTAIREALGGLVDDGTISDEQADEVADTLAEELPKQGPGGPDGRDGWGWHHGGGWGGGWHDTLTETLGLGDDELRTALQEGSSLAEIAQEQGVEVSALVDALVAEAQEGLASAVEEGWLTQEQADERSADLRERIQEMVEQPLPEGWRGHDGHGWGGWGWPDRDGSEDSEGSEESEESEEAPAPTPEGSGSATQPSSAGWGGVGVLRA